MRVPTPRPTWWRILLATAIMAAGSAIWVFGYWWVAARRIDFAGPVFFWLLLGIVTAFCYLFLILVFPSVSGSGFGAGMVAGGLTGLLALGLGASGLWQVNALKSAGGVDNGIRAYNLLFPSMALLWFAILVGWIHVATSAFAGWLAHRVAYRKRGK